MKKVFRRIIVVLNCFILAACSGGTTTGQKNNNNSMSLDEFLSRYGSSDNGGGQGQQTGESHVPVYQGMTVSRNNQSRLRPYLLDDMDDEVDPAGDEVGLIDTPVGEPLILLLLAFLYFFYRRRQLSRS